MVNTRIKRNLLPKLIAGVFTFYVYLLPVVLAGNWQSAYNNPRRQGYHQTDETLLNLCHIPNGQEGECRAISECWASQYNNYKFQSCGWNRYRETFCCPNWNEENVKFVSWYAQSPYRYPGEAISKTAPEPTRSSVRSFLGEIVEPIISSLFNVHSDEDDEENQRVTPGPISTTTKRSLRLPESVAVNFPIRYPATIPPRWPTERPAVVPPSRPAVVPPSRPAVVPPSRPASVMVSYSRRYIRTQSPKFSGCGRKHSENKHVLDARAIQPYVVGGYDAKDRSWPWMVKI
ncbi:UNVERIFIED_CONTAM: hypothetical protein NCL1_22777 [Trichonephila clavipes]